jgi:LysM repeat protein
MNRGIGQEIDTPHKDISYLNLPTTFILLTTLLIFLVFGTGNPILAEEDTIHIVRSGETLSGIAKIYGSTANALASYNGIANPNLLKTGYELHIPPSARIKEPTVAPPPTRRPTVPTPTPSPTPRPTSTPTPRAPRIHVVNAGETLRSIAAMYGTNVSAIKARNGLTSDTVFRGQRLIIP